MARLPLHNVRWLSIREIAKYWADDAELDEETILRELQLSYINFRRIDAGQERVDALPPKAEMPEVEMLLTREHLLRFCDKQGWPVPEFWFGREIREKGFAGRPAKKKRAIVQELERRAAAGELRDSLADQARDLSKWAAEKFPHDEVASPRTIENNIREIFRNLRGPRKENI
jgi:hypothetical protein